MTHTMPTAFPSGRFPDLAWAETTVDLMWEVGWGLRRRELALSCPRDQCTLEVKDVGLQWLIDQMAEELWRHTKPKKQTRHIRRRTNVQQLTCKIDLSSSFYYLFFSFVLIELKPFVLKGKVLGEKVLKSAKNVKNYETILPFSCCPLVFLWHINKWLIAAQDIDLPRRMTWGFQKPSPSKCWKILGTAQDYGSEDQETDPMNCWTNHSGDPKLVHVGVSFFGGLKQST